jgi:hypothetical protein
MSPRPGRDGQLLDVHRNHIAMSQPGQPPGVAARAASDVRHDARRAGQMRLTISLVRSNSSRPAPLSRRASAVSGNVCVVGGETPSSSIALSCLPIETFTGGRELCG